MGAPQFQQLEQIVAMPGPDKCAPVADDCSSFGCCAISGYYCFETSKGKAKCMKNCTPSKTQACIQTQPIMNPILKDATYATTSLYCFSTYMAETGQTKKTVDELGNLQVRGQRLLREPGDFLSRRLRDAGCQHRRLQGHPALEDRREGRQARPDGRGPLRAAVPGLAWRPPRGAVRHQHRRSVPGRPPEGRKEKQKVRAGLQIRCHAADTPVEDDGGLRSVLRRHCGRVRGLRKPGWAPCRAQRRRGGGRLRWGPLNAEPRNSEPFSRPVFRS